MSNICPANCAELTLTPNPAGGECDDLGTRNRSLYKFGIYLCSDPLPSPLTCAALETLVDANAVVFTSPLSDVTLSEPETESIKMNDCDPAVPRVIGRSITFNDKYKIEIPEGDKFADLTFWGNKKSASRMLRFLLVYCDGTLEIPKDENGKPLSSSFLIYRNFQTQGTGDNEYRIEIKTGTINFKGDPLQFSAPDLDLNESGCESLAAKIGFGGSTTT